MSSEHDESGEPLDEVSMRSDAEKSDSPSPKKNHGPGEHAKPKRRGRRGKKRKQRKESGDCLSSGNGAAHLRSEMSGLREHPELEANCLGDNTAMESSGSRVFSETGTNMSHMVIEAAAAVATPFGTDSPAWDSNEDLETTETETYSGQVIRPNAPQAPKNSTQFIIDDHNECRLYMSFETPNPYISKPPVDGGDCIAEPIGEDAAYIDIDFQYESPQDFDNSAYYDREFELSYKSNRFEELLRLSRDDLISGLQTLELRLKELSDDLVKENPSPILEKLQAKLLELQEKHFELKETNTKLTALVMQNEKAAAPNSSAGGSVIVSPEQPTRNNSSLPKSEDSSLGELGNIEPQMELNNKNKICNAHLVKDGSSEGIEIENRLHGTLCISDEQTCFSPGQVECDSVDKQTVSNSDTVYHEIHDLDQSSHCVESEELQAATV